jgi:hypothetical protein
MPENLYQAVWIFLNYAFSGWVIEKFFKINGGLFLSP